MPRKQKNGRGLVKYRRRRKRRSIGVPRPLLGKTFKQTHRYVSKIALNPGISAFTGTVFSANGMFDPDISGAGHQPLMFDQLTPLYNHYTVIASKINVAFISGDDNATTGSYVVGVRTASNATLMTIFEDTLENGDMNYRYIGQGNGGASKATVKKSCNIGKYLGQKVLQEDANAGDASNNPAEQVYYHVMAASFNGSDASIIYAVVTIDYLAVWHERKDLVGS